MPVRHKDFGSPVTPNADPIEFTIYGETFHAVAAIQGRVLIDIIRASTSEDNEESAAMVEEFFQKVLRPESWERFSKMLDNQDTIITVETLGEIVGWLVEQYSSRPEELRED